MSAELIAWGGPLPIIFTSLYCFGNAMGLYQKIAFIIIVYFLSITTGIFAIDFMEFGNYQSALVAGILSPASYSGVFYLIYRHLNSTHQIAEAIDSQADDRKTGVWNPIILAAIIQAVASIIVAIITILGGR